MSASLVGSEMCIRDRRRHGRSRHEGGRMEAGRGRPGRLRTSRGHAVIPVSYTHLTLPTICSV
eukprot:2093653-Alexandrium_andersonii.AAC.1